MERLAPLQNFHRPTDFSEMNRSTKVSLPFALSLSIYLSTYLSIYLYFSLTHTFTNFYNQSDQTAKSLFQYLAVWENDTVPNSIEKIPEEGSIFCPIVSKL